MTEVEDLVSVPIADDELDELRNAVRDAVRRNGGLTATRRAMASSPRYDVELWQTLAGQIGVTGLAIPEIYGGLGGSMVEWQAVLAELAAALAPVPCLGSAVVAAQAVLATGNESACARILPALASGERIAALCWADTSGWDAAGVSAKDGRLSGTASYVLDGEHADMLLVLARTESGWVLHEVQSPSGFEVTGVEVTAEPTMDPTRPLSTVRFDDVPATPIPGPADLAERIATIAMIALSAEQVGAARAALDLTVAYTTSRQQFGRPIGSFQALKHRMARMFELVETAQSVSSAAGAAVVSGSAEAPELVASARIYCSEAFEAVAAEMVQLHGGIGITWEHEAHLFFKRAHGSAHLFGGHPRSWQVIADAATI